MIDPILALNKACYCMPAKRSAIVDSIISKNAAPDMKRMLSERANYFANTSVFLSPEMIASMHRLINAIEDIAELPGYVDAVKARALHPEYLSQGYKTRGAFMGYDFHITDAGPRLIEVNTNAGGAFIVDSIEHAQELSNGNVAHDIASMFEEEWEASNPGKPLRNIAIVDSAPQDQYHYPDMCLAKSLLEQQGYTVIITDPNALTMKDNTLFHAEIQIDLIYNRLTDFDLTEPENAVIRRAYMDRAAVVTPAPHHHALYADKRNLILLSDAETMRNFGATAAQINTLKLVPKTLELKPQNAAQMWKNRKHMFFKPKDGFGGRGAFRGAKITKKVWEAISAGGYIAQEQVAPPYRAVTVGDAAVELKFDVRVYTYQGQPLLYAARVYQGQTTNLRTQGGGLAAVISTGNFTTCN